MRTKPHRPAPSPQQQALRKEMARSAAFHLMAQRHALALTC